jgi:tetratricopeptide (TPR) repeat protein
MFFNNDDEEDDGYGEPLRPIEEIQADYNRAKIGEPNSLSELELEILIDFFEMDGQKEGVAEAIEFGINHFPYNTTFRILRAELLLDQTKYGQAMKQVDAILLADPFQIDAIFLKIEIWKETEKEKEAIQYILNILPSFASENQCDLLLELSELYDTVEDFERVYFTLKQILQLDPNYEDALIRICFWCDVANMQEDAIQFFQEYTEEHPFNSTAYYNLGVAYQGLKLYEKAEEAYITCIDLDETYEFAYRNLGDAYIQQKKYKEAIEVLEKHMDIGNPEDVILEAIGFCWEKLKNYSKARKFYLQASQLSPADDSIFFKIGETYTKEKQWHKAFNAYNKALELNKDSYPSNMALGNVLLELGEVSNALGLFMNAIKVKQNTKAPWLHLIKALYMLEEYKECLTQTEVAKNYTDQKIEFEFCKVAALIKLGKTKEAVVTLETAMEAAPKKINTLSFIDPELMQHPLLLEVIAKGKKK